MERTTKIEMTRDELQQEREAAATLAVQKALDDELDEDHAELF